MGHILPSFIGITVGHYKDYDESISIMGCLKNNKCLDVVKLVNHDFMQVNIPVPWPIDLMSNSD